MARHTLRRQLSRSALGMAIVWALLIAGIFLAFHAGAPTVGRQCVTIGATSLYCTN